MGAGSRPGPWANSRAGGGGGVVLRLAASLSDPAPVTWLFWASVSSPVLVARGPHTEWCSGSQWSRGGPWLRRCTWAPRRWGRRAPSPICSLPLEARGRHLGGGAGGLSGTIGCVRLRPLPLLVNTFGREKEQVSNLKTLAMGAGLSGEQGPVRKRRGRGRGPGSCAPGSVPLPACHLPP